MKKQSVFKMTIIAALALSGLAQAQSFTCNDHSFAYQHMTVIDQGDELEVSMRAGFRGGYGFMESMILDQSLPGGSLNFRIAKEKCLRASEDATKIRCTFQAPVQSDLSLDVSVAGIGSPSGMRVVKATRLVLHVADVTTEHLVDVPGEAIRLEEVKNRIASLQVTTKGGEDSGNYQLNFGNFQPCSLF